MDDILINDEFRELLALYPLRVIAQKLHKRYGTVRAAAVKAGYPIRRGRPLKSEQKARRIGCALIRLSKGSDFCATCLKFDLMPAVLQAALDTAKEQNPTRFPPGADKRP